MSDITTKRCHKCNEIKPISGFSKDKSRKDNLSNRCKVCINFASSKWQKENKDKVNTNSLLCRLRHPDKRKAINKRYRQLNHKKILESSARYTKNNPDKIRVINQRKRARRKELPRNFTVEQWKNCLKYFNNCCAVCGRNSRMLAMDHWIPLSSPNCPGTIPTNIIPLCHGMDGCNNKKSGKEPQVWLEQNFDLNKAQAILENVQLYFAKINLD